MAVFHELGDEKGPLSEKQVQKLNFSALCAPGEYDIQNLFRSQVPRKVAKWPMLNKLERL